MYVDWHSRDISAAGACKQVFHIIIPAIGSMATCIICHACNQYSP